MNIERATIIIDGEEIEYPSMPAVDLAHELIKRSQPKLNTLISEETLQRWKREAALDYMNEPITRSHSDSHVALYMRLKAEQFFAIEYAQHAYNTMVIELTKKEAPAPEIFPGTNDSLNDLTIRKDENAKGSVTG